MSGPRWAGGELQRPVSEWTALEPMAACSLGTAGAEVLRWAT